MSKDDKIKMLADLLSLLGNPARVQIVMELQEGECKVGDLCKKIKARQPTVSHHLGFLRAAKLVTGIRKGREVYYALTGLGRLASAKEFRSLLKKSIAIRMGSIVIGIAQ